MNDLVFKSINEILFEKGEIVLPGLGVFETRHKEAQIDQVQGIVHPPAREISFYENKEKEDSSLQNHLVQNHGLQEEEAKSLIGSTVSHIFNQMDKKEIVNFQGLGRMYVDFEKNIQFLPDKTNFSKEAFGLPTLNFYPVLKRKEAVVAEAAATVIPSSPIPPSPSKATSKSGAGDWLSKIFPWLLGLSLVLVAIIFFWYWQSNRAEEPLTNDRLSEMDGRVNTSPRNSETAADTFLGDETDSTENQIVPEAPSPSGQKNQSSNTPKTPETSDETDNSKVEKPDLPPGMKESVIIVGGFASRENAQQMIREVSKAGYEAYSDKKGGLSRVGVSFLYKNESEIETKLQELKEKFNSSSWVLKY